MVMLKIILEGFKEENTPDMKYYAFDWDDNIVYMPTKIIVLDKNGEEVGMGTEDFAEYRTAIGKNDFTYEGHRIVDFAPNPFRNFRTEGDKKFLTDALKAKTGPAFGDFMEAINNGSIFSIITARGHDPNTIKQAVYNYIISDFNGIDKKQLVKNLKKYRKFTGIEEGSDKEMIEHYLDLCKFYPVTFGDEKNAVNPETAKVVAMKEFVGYVKEMAAIINKRAYLKSDLGNKFLPTIPSIGFSDDDIRNVEVMHKYFKDEPKNIVKTYSTTGGVKKRFNKEN
jgi:hypothetical protein